MVFLYCFAFVRDEEMVRLYAVSARALPIAFEGIYIGKPHHPACRTRQAFLLAGTTDGDIECSDSPVVIQRRLINGLFWFNRFDLVEARE